MKTTTSKSTSRRGEKKDTQSNESATSKLQKLFEEELKDIYWAEKALTKAIPKMVKNASSQDLKDALESHLKETEGHVRRCEDVFASIGKAAQTKKCEAMDGLIQEAEDIMNESDEGVMRDAGIISAGQKVEHYEIATYGTLRTFAKTLGLTEAVSLLDETLQEERAADEKLTEIAESSINVDASHVEEEEEAEE